MVLQCLLRCLPAEIAALNLVQAMKGAVAKAEEIAAKTKGAYILQQFENPANADIHRETTGPEIWRDTCGQVRPSFRFRAGSLPLGIECLGVRHCSHCTAGAACRQTHVPGLWPAPLDGHAQRSPSYVVKRV